MELNESLEHFIDQFLHICYQFPNEYVDWQFLDEKFNLLVSMSRKFFESHSSCSHDQEYHQHLEEEPYILFVPCPPPFDVSYVEPKPITKPEDQFANEELIFLSHLSHDGNSSDLMNQTHPNLDITLVDILPFNQIESLDNHDHDDFLFSQE